MEYICKNQIDKNFLDNVLYIQIDYSTGVGGYGGLWFLTKEEHYIFNFLHNSCDEQRLESVAYLLKLEDQQFVAEKEGWKRIKRKQFVRDPILVRKEFYEEFQRFVREEESKKLKKKGFVFIHYPDLFTTYIHEKNI